MKPPKISAVRRFRDMVPARDCPGPPRAPHSQNRSSRGPGRDLAGKRRSGFYFRALGAGIKGGGAESAAGTAEKVEPGLGAGLRAVGAGPRPLSTCSPARAPGSRWSFCCAGVPGSCSTRCPALCLAPTSAVPSTTLLTSFAIPFTNQAFPFFPH